MPLVPPQTDMAGGGGVPNSPLSWVRDCVEAFAPGGPGSKVRSMTLIGLPFYGEYVYTLSTSRREQEVNPPPTPPRVKIVPK